MQVVRFSPDEICTVGGGIEALIQIYIQLCILAPMPPVIYHSIVVIIVVMGNLLALNQL